MIPGPWVRDINSTQQVVKTQEGRQGAKAKHGESITLVTVICLDSQETCHK